MFWDPLSLSELFPLRRGLAAPRTPFLRLPGPPPARRPAPPDPAINLRANEEEARVTALVPGLAADDLELSLEGDLLTIAGEIRPWPDAEELSATTRRRERFAGRFSRTLRLPFPPDRERITATLERGVLSVTLPRAEEDRPRRIEVQSR